MIPTLARLLSAILWLGILFPSVTAHAATSETMTDETMTIRLVSDRDGVNDNTEITLALDIRLAEGWHAYWRTPGAAGSPPRINWTGSTNLKEAALLFPAPFRASFFGMDSIVYKGDLTLPIKARLETPLKSADIKADVDILVCKELCLPKNFKLTLNLAAKGSQTSSEARIIRQTLANMPNQQNTPALSIDHVSRTDNQVHVAISSTKTITAPDMFIETPREIEFSKPEVKIDPDGHHAILVSPLTGQLPDGVTLKTQPLTLTIVNQQDAVEAAVKQDGPIQQQAHESTISKARPLWHFLLLALLGGFILNLMPCVLPVLSLKILAVIKHGGNEPAKIRQSFLASGSGIVVSFLILATATLTLKQAGMAIGWGVQFQQPTFLVGMILLLTIFTANLWGLLLINLPRFMMDRLDPVHHPKLAGDFAAGMLATLLATPCSAPFLGTAVGFALAADRVALMTIFLALGLGMALPYYAIALFPRIASAFPKPGKWVERLTHLLGLGLALTALWLLTVLNEQIGRTLSLIIAAGMTGILVQLYMRKRKCLVWATAPVIGGAAIIAFIIAQAATVPTSLNARSGLWKPFDEAAIQRYVAEGKTVFVDVTADWCITCKANKRFTLSRKDIADKIFNNPDVIAMQGDWTSPDPLITAFLQKQGRYGIPFNAVYGPAAPQGILLPELLTPSSVTKALEQAQSR